MAGSLRLDNFKGKVADVARPNRFWVQITGEMAGQTWGENFSFLCKSFSVPGRTLGDIELSWQGMKTKIAGDPSFDDLSMTVLSDYAYEARAFFDAWVDNIAEMDSNNRLEPEKYKAKVMIEHLGRTDGEVIARYELVGAYPKSYDAIELSQESMDTAEEFSVNFGYDYFEILEGGPV